MTTATEAVCYDGDFDPFGGEHTYTDTCPQSYKFEGKERDTETGNDDFGARYYTNRFGRWLSADWSSVPVAVPYANLTNPQTLNLYAMVADDPESFADLDGHCCDFSSALDGIKDEASFFGQELVGIAKTAVNILPATYNLGATVLNAESANSSLGPLNLPLAPTLPLTSLGQVVGADVATLGLAATGLTETGPTASAATSTIEENAARGSTTPKALDVPESIPAGPSARPTAAQQKSINQIGDAHGCHTCGAETPGTKSGNWVGDHQPPTAQNPPGAPQVYKPQCLQCSRQQGGQVAAAVKAAKKQEQPQ